MADMMNHTIQVFSPDDGKFLYRFGKYGLTTTPGALVSPMAIAIDAEDNVYVSNSTGSIVIFSKEGEFRRQFGSYGSEQGQFGMIKGLHIDRKGRLFVSEWMSNRVQIFPTSLSAAQPNGDEDESSDSVAVTQEALEEKTNPPAPVCKVGPTSSVPIKVIPDIQYANGITEGKNGEVVVIGTRESKVKVYSSANDYKLTREFGGKGYGDDQFYNPSGVTLTPEGLILVCSSNKLQWFTMEGDIVHVVGYREHDQNKNDLGNPEDVVISKDGLIYVLDTGKKCVKVLRNDGTFHSSFTFPHLDTDDKKAPTAMAINSEEKLYFTDSAENCVRVFSTTGEALFKFGKSGNWMERGALMSPFAIAIDHNDNVFVGSLIMVSIFDKSGAFLRSFGGHDQFSFIKGIHIGNSGHIYISDQSKNNVKIFEGPKPGDSNKPPGNQKVVKLPFPRPLYTVGPSSKQPVKVIPAVMEPHGAATAANGDLFVVAKKSKKIPIFSGDSFEQAGEIGRLYSDKARYTEMADLEDIVPSDKGSFLIAMNHQVLEVMPNGDVTAAFGTPGRRGNTETQLYSPTGIAVGRRGLVFVVDSGNNRIKILNADLSYKTSAAFPENTVDSPSLQKIALSSKGSIYVTDSRNNLIHVFNQAGKFLFSFEAISSPGAIAVDHEDFLYIADSNNIRIFDGEGHFVRAFGARGDKPGEFGVIKALHISDAGNLFVSECKNNRIQVFTGLKSRAQAEKDRASEEEAVLDTLVPDVCLRDVHDPFGIAAGMNGEIVVANTSENKVSVYNDQQQLVVQFGVRGTLDGQMVAPTGITITADNYILVSCRDKLQWFTMKGELVYAVGNKGKEVLEFDYPLSIALGKDENIYVLEKGSKRVQVLKGDASFHSSFDFDKKHTPEAIAIDSQGRIFLVDTRKSCVQIYSQEGTQISMFNMTGSSAPTFPTAIAIDHKDNVYIGSANGEVFVFDNCGCFLQGFRASGSPGCYSVIRGLHVSLSGHVYISDFSTNELRAFKQLNIFSSAEGMSASIPLLPVLPYSPIYKVGPKSAQPVRVLSGVRDPNGVVTDNHGNVIVTSKQDNKILIYSSDDSDKPLNAISELKNPREPTSKRMINPAGLEYTHDGYLLVCFSAQMVKMDYSGTAVAFLGNPRNRSGTRDDEMSGPGGIALGSKGEIFLVDRGNHRIQIFNSNFTFVKSLFNPDSRERSHEYLERVAVNSAGDLYVTDYRNHNIQVYNKDGRFMFTFGKELKDIKERFYKRGGLSSPYAIAIDKDDFVYVGDKNGVVSIFDKDGGFVRSFGGSGDQPGQFGNIQAMHFDAEGQLYVCEWKTNRVQVFK